MPTSVPFLDREEYQNKPLFMRAVSKCRKFFVCWFLCSGAYAYTVVTLSTGAPESLEQQLIAQTTTQFNAQVVANPFFKNTYQITLYGQNSAYNPPVTSVQLLQQIDLDAQYMATVDSYTYVNGWADGESYQQSQDINTTQAFTVNCSSPTYWNVPIDSATCLAVSGRLEAAIYNESLSTPTVVPGNFQ